MIYRSWELAKPNKEESLRLQKELGAGRLLADVLAGRGLYDQARELLLGESPLADPFLMLDMDRAARRVSQAVEQGEKIVIFGDYDVDGITATALLFSYLESAGADVYYKLPSRSDDGYGLSESVVRRLHKAGAQLIVTVDSGVSCAAEVELAGRLGMDVVVTDHHLPPEALPDAAAVVDPMRPGDPFPEKHLSGVGVAFRLICAMEGCAPEELADYYADLVAIGTIADIMPLTGENRRLVRQGVGQLADTHRPGLAALIQQAGLSGKPVTAENVSYALGPRLNAAGRMGDATEALRLLLTDDVAEAQELAQELCERNSQRQQIEQEIMAAAVERIDADPAYAAQPVLVAWGAGLHQGVIGIVASRLVERYGKPAIVISVDENGEGKGSGRSVEGFSLHGAIAACAPLLIRYGGHDLAAGLSIEEGKIPAFRAAINEYARTALKGLRRAGIAIDAETELPALTTGEVEGLSALAPYGNSNPSPLFLVRDAVVEGVYPVQEGRHTRLRLRQKGAVLYAMRFGISPAALPYGVGDRVDAVVALSVYRGQNGATVSARLRDLRPAGMGEAHAGSADLYGYYRMGGRLSAGQRAQLLPDRAQVALVYRAIGAGRFVEEDLRPLFAKLPQLPAGQILTAVAALLELGLVEAQPGTGVLKKAQVQGKRDLADSRVLSALHKQEEG